MADRSGSPDSCAALLQTMVAVDTVNSNISGRPDAELELSLRLEEIAGGLDLETRRLPVSGEGFNLLVSLEVGAGRPWLLFESHLDTVSVSGMTIPPFAGEIRDGRLWGRGACDTKGTGAAMLSALTEYASGGEQPNNVAIVYTLDEEVGKQGIRTFAERQLPELGWKPAGAIVGEPTGLLAVVAHNGIVRWSIETRGVAAHSCAPERGKSAISMMMRVIDALESRYIPSLEASHELTGRARCSINVIDGGVQANIVPERCRILLDRRLVPGEDWREVFTAVERVLDEVRAEHPWIEVEQPESGRFVLPPLDPRQELSADADFARVVCSALERLDLPATPSGVQYGTDAPELSDAGVPAVVLGPGNIEQAHTKDEWIDLDELARGVAVYREIMRSAV